MARKPSGPTRVDDYNHDDSRMNIPTAETSDFMTDDQRAPQQVEYQRYRRDPALDPQLVWQGKDAEDANDLAVWVHPIYVHEKVLPRAIIENVRAMAAEHGPAAQMSLFDDYDGIGFEEQVEFYQHEQHWSNRMILGDSLAVMASLAEKEALRGKVQMIYIDPPYGITFSSNWQPSTLKHSVKDGTDVTYEPEQIRAFRDTWRDGIHSYLSYLRDRLRVARELLTDSGSLFVQIGDENVHLVRSLLDEVLGSENFISQIAFKKTGGQSSTNLPSVFDHLLWYAKAKGNVKFRQLYFFRSPGDEGATQYDWIETASGLRQRISQGQTIKSDDRIFQAYPMVSMGVSPKDQNIHLEGKVYSPSPGRHWTIADPNAQERLKKANRLIGLGQTLRFVNYLDDYPVTPYTNLWTDTQTSGFSSDRIYVVQTLTTVIERCMLMTTDPGDIVLDPTCGSGTTAFVAEQWGRRWITIDTSRVALALARTRLMSARFKMYTLRDPGAGPRSQFIYRTVPHVMPSSVANNLRIDDIHERFQPALDAVRAEIVALAGKDWQEWEIPRPADNSESPLNIKLNRWWELRRDRQNEIDRAIADAADQETLYDQPEIQRGVVRVSGPFTVESLSPHRALDAGQSAVEADNAQTFVSSMLDQLRAAGVTNTRKGERIQFTQIDAYAGRYINAAGTYQTAAGASGRVAVVFGPQYGTVSKQLIVNAAQEAVRERIERFDLLLVCGFAFDPEVTEAAKDMMGRIQVQTARISPDLLLMGDALKKDGKGSLFTVFGEPDVEVETLQDGRRMVHLKGVDVYDPNKGEVRSSSTDEIACWFVDTNYDNANFFVRHAYFTGDNDPYENLKRALKSEINSEAWEALYKTDSLPFDAPANGKIAVKVINHHGDEVMRVLDV
jgi:adenine-specific DNA-methyltransferase